MGKGKPKQWEACPKMSTGPIFGRFVAFKTPYNGGGSSSTEDTFTVSSVFELAAERGMKLGMWIDLTDTCRYYDGSEVEKNNCTYVKIRCPGRHIKKTKKLVQQFNSICNQFFEKYPSSLVGVHCLHGFNRTGFFIVSYMVEEVRWELASAVAEFARVRSPGIYRKEKLDELSRKYNVPLTVPRPPSFTEMDRKDKSGEVEKNHRGKSQEVSDKQDSDGWTTVSYRKNECKNRNK